MSVNSPGSAIAIGFCFPILTGVFVALRFHTRCQQKAAKKLDDWLCLPAWLALTGCCVSLLAGVFLDAFSEQPRSDPNDVPPQKHLLAQVEASIVVFYIVANAFIKLSISFFYRRIFFGCVFNVCIWILIGLSLVWVVYAILSWLLYCGTNFEANFEGGWDVCPSWAFRMQTGWICLDSFIDFALLILPISFVLKLRVRFSRKVVIVLSFLVGGLAFVASLNNTIVQMVSLTQPDVVANAAQGRFFKGRFFQGSTLLMNWPTIEIGVGLIACNLPSLSSRALSSRTLNSITKQVRRDWRISWSAIITIFSSQSPRQSEGNTPVPNAEVSAMAPSWINSRSDSLKYVEEGRLTAVLDSVHHQGH